MTDQQVQILEVILSEVKYCRKEISENRNDIQESRKEIMKISNRFTDKIQSCKYEQDRKIDKQKDDLSRFKFGVLKIIALAAGSGAIGGNVDKILSYFF